MSGNTVERTPGPIHIEHSTNLVAADGLPLTAATGTDSSRWHARAVANAQHAVVCWNSHDALVAAAIDAACELEITANTFNQGPSGASRVAARKLRDALKLAGKE